MSYTSAVTEQGAINLGRLSARLHHEARLIVRVCEGLYLVIPPGKLTVGQHVATVHSGGQVDRECAKTRWLRWWSCLCEVSR